MISNATYVNFIPIDNLDIILMGFKVDTFVPINVGEIITLNVQNKAPETYLVESFNDQFEVVKIEKKFSQRYYSNVKVDQDVYVYVKKLNDD
jgi:hypothetical protein